LIDDGRTTKLPVVLVVEDEPLILMLAVEIVEEAGFLALSGSNASQAIAIFESRSDITILFTDIDMKPGMDGAALAALVRERWPPVAIIVASGFHNQADLKLPADTRFFKKPYDQTSIISALKAA